MISDGFRLFPEQASTQAQRVDLLYFSLVGLSLFIVFAIAALIVYFSIKYRRTNLRVDRTPSEGSTVLEITWMVIPFVLAMGIFFWGAWLYVVGAHPPADALELHVVARQWMWKFQHANGRREIDTLHVPLGRPVRLTMISEDVIHSFFVPAFRVKRDVLPGTYASCWFEATRAGEFHLFCAEYCGTNHSRMTGRVIVMEPADYESWLERGRAREPPSAAGKRLFEDLRCSTCHAPTTGPVRCPPLESLYGREILLRDDSKVVADDQYLRESILRPHAKIVKGYEPLMPTFDGQLDEEQLLDLIAYIKSLAAP